VWKYKPIVGIEVSAAVFSEFIARSPFVRQGNALKACIME